MLIRTSMPLSLLVFSYLQILDLLSTIAFMMLGARELNPLVRWSLTVASNPITGLLLAKAVAVLIGVYCWFKGRERVLISANLIFALVVAWNLMAVIITASRIS